MWVHACYVWLLQVHLLSGLILHLEHPCAAWHVTFSLLTGFMLKQSCSWLAAAPVHGLFCVFWGLKRWHSSMSYHCAFPSLSPCYLLLHMHLQTLRHSFSVSRCSCSFPAGQQVVQSSTMFLLSGCLRLHNSSKFSAGLPDKDTAAAGDTAGVAAGGSSAQRQFNAPTLVAWGPELFGQMEDR